jgi:hypothetical protein
MNASRSISGKFIDAVYRRMIVIQLLEQMGRALLVSSVLAILLMPIAIWQSMPALPILLSMAIIGLVAGILLAILRLPTRQAAAAEADRQLCLDDLLSTAIGLASSDAEFGDEFARAMRWMADARCAAHSPSDVILRRLGVGSWGAIALAMSVATTLAVIPFGPSRSQAVDANAAVLSAVSKEPSVANQAQGNNHVAPSNNNPASEGATNISSSGDSHTDPKSGDPNPNGSGKSQNATGTGGGSSTTTAKPKGDPLPGESAGRSNIENGTTAGGGAVANIAGQNHDQASQSNPAGSPSITAVPPWSALPDDIAGSTGPATPSINSDRVPPAHRDLVRDFFSGR